jgi:uracil phosphoribosyltransferase
MTHDSSYSNLDYTLSEIDHKYGNNIHLLNSPYLLTLLDKICADKVVQPLFTEYIRKAYSMLFTQAGSHFMKTQVTSSPTRMSEFHKEGVYHGDVFEVDTNAVVVDLARAGMIPSQLIYNELNYLFDHKNIRQDHFYAARKTNELGEVTGVDISGSKIGGDINDAYVIFPDPMGATGGTISEAISFYKKHVPGTCIKFITLHLIITPEYIKRIQKDHPEVEVYTIRLDRGLSSEKALKAMPGEFIEEEKGLNANQYIIPGAGGIGELLNNSFV